MEKGARSMKLRGEDADLRRQIEALGPKGQITVEAEDVAGVVEAVVASLSGDMSVADLKLYRELEQLAQYIQVAKREIAEIRPHEITERIPAATDELDAVVDHTAEATGTILDAAESIEKAAAGLPRESADLFAAAVTRIYEACNFQDVTGQRITKVVTTLKYIEHKIDALLAAFGDGINDGLKKAPPPAPAPVDEHATFLHGPALPKEANNQADIDAILASFD
jgi:chemotaxis protein CheZ